MSADTPAPATPEPLPPAPPPAPAPAPAPAPVLAAAAPRWLLPLAALALLGAGVAATMAWRAEQRVASLEQELVRRQQDSATQATEARTLARQAQEAVTANGAKVALLEARVAEVAIQRTQLEDLIQSLSRSRDENLLVDIEAAIRMALQQGAITGSPEPLVLVLRQSDERIARYNQPRLEGVRRAIVRDLDRVKAVGSTDVSTLTIRLDEAIRMVDELPLLASADQRRDPRAVPAAPAAASAAASAPLLRGLPADWTAAWSGFAERLWGEVRALVRVTRIDHPEAMLLAPEQAFFLRENLKLRLLNARLALLSRQYATVQADLAVAQATLDRYFDRGARRTGTAGELLRQVAQQARQVSLPRPDETLAALTAATAGR